MTAAKMFKCRLEVRMPPWGARKLGSSQSVGHLRYCRWRSKKTVQRAHCMLDVKKAGNCSRPDAVLHKQILEFQRVLAHLKGPGPPQEARVQPSQVRCIDVGGGLLTGEGGDVVIVIIRHSRVGPGVGIFIFSSIEWERGGGSNPVADGSVYESGQKPSLADVLGGTARVIAALCPKMAIWISCFHLC